jgi:3-oxoacyl-(acyl-carrier-protein) synthase
MTERVLHRSAVLGDGQDLAAWAAEVLTAAGLTGDGLYVATTTAGSREAVDFWRDAKAVGLAFANPRLFPWTLANSPTGAMASALGIRGPAYTLVGTADAVDAAFGHAADDLREGIVGAALVVAVDGLGGHCELAAVALAGDALGWCPASGGGDFKTAAAALASRLAVGPVA